MEANNLASTRDERVESAELRHQLKVAGSAGGTQEAVRCAWREVAWQAAWGVLLLSARINAREESGADALGEATDAEKLATGSGAHHTLSLPGLFARPEVKGVCTLPHSQYDSLP